MDKVKSRLQKTDKEDLQNAKLKLKESRIKKKKQLKRA
jgi:hypothetical protein